MEPDAPRRRRLVVSVTDERGRPLAAHGLARWAASIAPRAARGSVSIALLDDARVRELNRRYRRKDRATDVLSFAGGGSGVLGDIAIATGVARRQAREAGHSYRDELRILALHGLLHLLGYDHESDAGEMRHIEETLRARGGLRRGLIARNSKIVGATTRASDSKRAGRAAGEAVRRAKRGVSVSSARGGGAPRAVRNASATAPAAHHVRNRSR